MVTLGILDILLRIHSEQNILLIHYVKWKFWQKQNVQTFRKQIVKLIEKITLKR